jgi:MoxR-like ATPase
MNVDEIRERFEAVFEAVGRVVLGQGDTLRLLAVALLSEGHALLEGVPGTAKTLLARCFAASLSLEFKRIQFTPDLMPGDVVGTNLFNFQSNAFTFAPGPIFTQFLLADEINRTPPKTQSALLEAMEERKVTIDGTSHVLGDGFIVVATQNPIEHEGTYPLPEAQLDRFLFKVLVGYPDREQESEMVRIHGHQRVTPDLQTLGLRPLADLDWIRAARTVVSSLRLADELVDYIVALIHATRSHPSIQFGASPRSANMLATSSRALAVLEGRDFVIPDDIQFLFRPVMRHRLVLAPATEVEGRSADEVVGQILDQIEAPR